MMTEDLPTAALLRFLIVGVKFISKRRILKVPKDEFVPPLCFIFRHHGVLNYSRDRNQS